MIDPKSTLLIIADYCSDKSQIDQSWLFMTDQSMIYLYNENVNCALDLQEWLQDAFWSNTNYIVSAFAAIYASS